MTVLMSRDISQALREEQRAPAGGSVGDQPTDQDMWSGSRVISPPSLFPRTVAHRKSESTHTQTHRGECAHTSKHAQAHKAREKKKNPGRCSRVDPVTVPLQQPCSQHSDDLLLELVNTGHPERERERGRRGWRGLTFA